MENKTAIQVLLELIETGSLDSLFQVKSHLKHIGLEMEKQQIIDAHCDGQDIEDTAGVTDAEQYYNSTYGKEN